MSELTKALGFIADNLITKKHTEINEISTKTKEEKIAYCNAVSTLIVHRDHIINNTLWEAS